MPRTKSSPRKPVLEIFHTGPATFSAPRSRSPNGLVGSVPLGHRSGPSNDVANILQISEDFDDERMIAQLLLGDFRQAHANLHDDEEWFAWIGAVDYHPKGLTFRVATSSNVPPKVLGGLESIIRVMGFPTARTTGSPSSMNPLLYVGPEGVELLRMI